MRGAGPLEAELRAQARAARRAGCGSRARWRPASSAPSTPAADVLALVSSYEPFGVTLREGAAAGLPLIASRRAGAVGRRGGGGRERARDRAGDRGQIAAALRRLVREPELRERLAAGSRAVTARHPLGGRCGGVGAGGAAGACAPLSYAAAPAAARPSRSRWTASER